MIEAKLSFTQVEAAPTKRAKRMAPLLGLGFGAVISMGLWGALALTVSRIF
ncbi:hypothetical protein [Caulobacter sp. 1776]|uniref:hypothetical protein n=1 Tax=Caulobacter sp. 1776 TaxID=3156420 RepID=UPI003395575A